jgi:hypothetical protein
MKKLGLKDLSFQKGEVLTRNQLKNVLGGSGSGSGSGSGGHTSCKSPCKSDADCGAGLVCKAHRVEGCPHDTAGCYLP